MLTPEQAFQHVWEKWSGIARGDEDADPYAACGFCELAWDLQNIAHPEDPIGIDHPQCDYCPAAKLYGDCFEVECIAATLEAHDIGNSMAEPGQDVLDLLLRDKNLLISAAQDLIESTTPPK